MLKKLAERASARKKSQRSAFRLSIDRYAVLSNEHASPILLYIAVIHQNKSGSNHDKTGLIVLPPFKESAQISWQSDNPIGAFRRVWTIQKHTDTVKGNQEPGWGDDFSWWQYTRTCMWVVTWYSFNFTYDLTLHFHRHFCSFLYFCKQGAKHFYWRKFLVLKWNNKQSPETKKNMLRRNTRTGSQKNAEENWE